jgi:hypothetical protein
MGWQARGRDEQRRRSQGFEPTESEQPFLDFLDAITRARAAAKVTMIGHVATAAQTDWRAAAWYLERVDRAQFGKYVDLEKLDAAQIEDLIAELDDELEQGPEPPAALPAAGESSTALRGGIQSEP